MEVAFYFLMKLYLSKVLPKSMTNRLAAWNADSCSMWATALSAVEPCYGGLVCGTSSFEPELKWHLGKATGSVRITLGSRLDKILK